VESRFGGCMTFLVKKKMSEVRGRGHTVISQSTQLPYLTTCQNREIGKRFLGGLWAFSQESPDTNTENWIPFPKRLKAHLLRARHLSTTGRAAPRISRTKARMAPDAGGRYVEAAGHARAMGPVSAAAAARGEGAGSWRDAPLF